MVPPGPQPLSPSANEAEQPSPQGRSDRNRSGTRTGRPTACPLGNRTPVLWAGTGPGRPRGDPGTLPTPPGPREAHLLGEVLDDAVLRHLGADGKAALELLLDAAQHLLVLLAGEALHPWGHEKGDGAGAGGRDLSRPTAGGWEMEPPCQGRAAGARPRRENYRKRNGVCEGVRPDWGPQVRGRGCRVGRGASGRGNGRCEAGGRNTCDCLNPQGRGRVVPRAGPCGPYGPRHRLVVIL